MKGTTCFKMLTLVVGFEITGNQMNHFSIYNLSLYQECEMQDLGPQWPSGLQVWHLIIGCHLCGFESHKWQF